LRNGARNTCRKKKPSRKARKTERQTTIEALDKVFSHYIRLKYTKTNGLIDCATCQASLPFKMMQAGHFMSRRYIATRFHEINVLPQCRACNMFAQGRQWLFGKRLDAMYGPGTAQRMYELSRSDVKYNVQQLRNMLNDYKTKKQAMQNDRSDEDI